MREESHLPRRCDRTLPRGAEGRGAPLRFSRPASAARAEGRDGQVQAHPKVELRVSADAQADMPSAKASGAICVQRFDDSLTSCNSHYVSHFAAFFIVARAKISVVESFGYLRRGGFRRNRPDGFSIVFGVCVCVLRTRPPEESDSSGAPSFSKEKTRRETIKIRGANRS